MNLLQSKEILNSQQYLILEWLDVAFSYAQIFETILETESLSLKKEVIIITTSVL